MKVTLKNVFAVISALAIVQSVFALETGGLLTNDSKFLNAERDGSLKLDQKNGINLWFRNPVSQDGSSYIAGEGSFLFEKDMRIEDSEKQLKLYADLNLLKLVAKGNQRDAIAASLGIGAESVKTHLKGIMTKLGCPNATSAVSRAYELGILRA